MNPPPGCTCTYLDGIHADTCTLIDGHPWIGTPPVINHDDGATPTAIPAKETAYSDGLRRAFTEALDTLRALPTGPQLEAAVLIRERAHQWGINL